MSNGLVTIQSLKDQFPALADPSRMKRVIADNFGDEGVNMGSLPTICVAGQGKEYWNFKEGGKERPVESFTGILLAFAPFRLLYLDKGSGGQPDCVSVDTKAPVDPEMCKAWNPAGKCVRKMGTGRQAKTVAVCPYAEFGSGVDEKGNATDGCRCPEKMNLIVMLPGKTLPYRLQLPPTSLKAFRLWRAAMMAAELSFYEAVIQFTVKARTIPSSGWKVSEAAMETYKVDGAPAVIPEAVQESLGLHGLRRIWGELLTEAQPASLEGGGEGEGEGEGDDETLGDQVDAAVDAHNAEQAAINAVLGDDGGAEYEEPAQMDDGIEDAEFTTEDETPTY
jgi:hypothetical protein